MNKVVILDSGVILHRSIFAYGAEKKRRVLEGNEEEPIPASYTYLNTCYAILKKIGIDRSDIVIIAQDSRNSWRKAFLESYKGQRKALRDSHEHINWGLQYSLINKLETQLNNTTNWHFMKLENIFNYADLVLTKEGEALQLEQYGNVSYDTEFGIESDDIQAVACQRFTDKEIILVTIDEDISQLTYYPNVKIFNPNLKSPTNKAQRGFYKIVKDPQKILTKKIRLGDKSDNILVDKNKDTERDILVRKLIIDLLHLPDWVERPIIHCFEGLNYQKEVNYNNLPFKNSLGKRFDTIYESNNTRTYEESVIRQEKKDEIQKEKRKKVTA